MERGRGWPEGSISSSNGLCTALSPSKGSPRTDLGLSTSTGHGKIHCSSQGQLRKNGTKPQKQSHFLTILSQVQTGATRSSISLNNRNTSNFSCAELLPAETCPLCHSTDKVWLPQAGTALAQEGRSLPWHRRDSHCPTEGLARGRGKRAAKLPESWRDLRKKRKS